MKKFFFSLCAALLSIGSIIAQDDPIYDDSTPIVINISDTICEGHPYILGGHALSEKGVYYDTAFSYHQMRDSITVLTLFVKPASYTRISDVIVVGDSYTYGDTILTTEGVYTRYLPAVNGCDSIIHLQLGILYPPCDTVRTSIKEMICEGDEYLFCGRLLTQAGVYIDTVPKADNSCDSIVTLTLEVHPSSSASLEKTIHTDEIFSLAARLVDTTFKHPIPGVYEHTVISTNQYGCDSIISLTLNAIDRETASDIPTMFSPYEGIKDVFLRGRDLELYIYDRYGNLISHNKVGEGWDGRYKGVLVDPGVYVYVAKYSNGKIKKGTIEAIKED